MLTKTNAHCRNSVASLALLDEHCGPDAYPHREFNPALEILESTCECQDREGQVDQRQ